MMVKRNYLGNQLDEKIVKKGNEWQVQSEKGRNMGTYKTKEEAEKRLKQIEYFKNLDEYWEKDIYQRKQNFVDSKNRKNREIAIDNGLEEEQIDMIEWICAIRHDVHCNQEAFFYSEYSNFDKYNNYPENINDKLIDVDLPTIDFSKMDKWAPNDSDYDVDYGGGSFDTMDDALEYVIENVAEPFNKAIEKWLSLIDKKYKTNYCPTGYSRLY